MKRKLRAILKVYGFSFIFGCHLAHIYSTTKRLTLLIQYFERKYYFYGSNSSFLHSYLIISSSIQLS